MSAPSTMREVSFGDAANKLKIPSRNNSSLFVVQDNIKWHSLN